jgi:trans-aconitate methyltransferase
MRLLSDNELIWSAVVVNNRMNRERKASGINSYEKEFSFKPEAYIESLMTDKRPVAWLDLCCGKGNALKQAAEYFDSKQKQDRVFLHGIDLLDDFCTVGKNITCLHFETVPLTAWRPSRRYDLITCSHGLHYIGDKLRVIETAVASLTKNGFFIAHLDLDNISIANKKSSPFLKSLFKKVLVDYNSRKKILKAAGAAILSFDLMYIGADDTSGPNYTGQEAVTSYYEITP